MRFYSGMKKIRLSLCSSFLLLFAFVSIFTLTTAASAADKGKYLFYVGTYTQEGSKSKGIYAYRYDAATDEITPLGLAAEATDPSFVAVHPSGRFLYAGNELGNYKGPNSRRV